MFKARKSNPKLKGKFRKQKREDDDDENDAGEKKNSQESLSGHNNNGDKVVDGTSSRMSTNDNNNTADAIARIKKKRKLLTDLQYKKGTNAASLLTGHTHNNNPLTNKVEDGANTAAAATTDNTASSSQEGIMEQKHKQALEDYVEAKLADIAEDSVQKNQRDMNGTGGEQALVALPTTNQHQQPKLTKEELYKQLAQTSESMAGRSTGNDNNNNNTDADGDVGAGGAMLVAGTGLAEVILPVNERLKVVAAAQQAAAQQGTNKGKTYFGMPATNSHALPAGTARFSVSAADKHRHFANSSNQRGGGQQANNNNNNNQQNQATAAGTSAAAVEETAAEKSRMGFEARQGKAVATTNTATGINDKNQRYQNDSKHTRASDDKVYGKFIKKQRDNQRRGR